MKTTQQGFTLIELITVIVILGILSAFALPRFAGIEKQARIAALNGMGGSMRSAATLAHGTQLAEGLTSGAAVTMEGVSVAMINAYPTAAGIASALQDTTGFSNPAAGTFRIANAPDSSNCKVVYAPATATTAPTVTPTIGGC